MAVLIIHGIGGYAGIHWQQWLHDELSDSGNTVIMPTLSNADHPDRSVWLAELIKSVGDTDPSDLIIVGHSLGVTTALDFVEQIASPVKALISVSGFATDYEAELNSYFLRLKHVNFDKVRKNIQQSFVLFGDNDPYVTQAALHEVATELRVTPIIISEGGHLNSETGYTKFPKLLEIIESIK